jgi:biotin operon repressor
MQRTEDGPPTEDEAADPQRRRPGGTAASGSRRAAMVNDRLRANDELVQYHYVQFLTEHLVDCRRTIGGDFDNIMIIAVLGQRLLEARLKHDAGEAEAADRVWMSALRLADVTGIARESVRRKLSVLKARGWVERNPRHGWRLTGSLHTAQAADDLSDLDGRSLDRLTRLMAALLPVISGQAET